jgi:chlorobactene glucosyltransferase
MTAWFLIAGLPLLTLLMALFNAFTWRRGNSSYSAPAAALSILIPARNEGRNIREAVESVLQCEASSAILEVLVYDDGSTDGTDCIVENISRKDARVKLIAGSALPDGWIGKPHACHCLAGAARADLLLFMDADVRLKPNGLGRLLSLLSAPAQGRVVSAVPQQISVGFFERLVIPMLLLTYLAWLPLRLVERGKNPRTVAANGQLLLVGREDYRALGGFAAVRNEIVDDVAFCRHAKKNGCRVVFADGFHMASCRMYCGAEETIAGFAKNLFEGVGSASGLLLVCSLYVLAFLFPYLSLASAMGTHSPLSGVPFFSSESSYLAASLTGVTAIISQRILLAARFGQPWSGVPLHPLSILSFLYIAGASFLWQVRKSVTWRGRSYKPLAQRRTDRQIMSPDSPSHSSAHSVRRNFT